MLLINHSGKRAPGELFSRATLTVIFTLAIMVGSLVSPLIPSVTADTIATAARIDNQQAAALQGDDASPVDTDGDGLTDDDELNIHGTDPNSHIVMVTGLMTVRRS